MHARVGHSRLALVGMSNAGKSWWARTLHDELGFEWHHVDGCIQEALGFASMEELSAWLGYPYTPGYDEREARYLELEDQFTREGAICERDALVVCDTTGSVVNLSDSTLKCVRENCTVVHFDVGDEAIDDMIARFFETPKPVAWCGFFTQTAGESNEDALRRCYPELLRDRLARYRALAHVSIPVTELAALSAEEFVERATQ